MRGGDLTRTLTVPLILTLTLTLTAASALTLTPTPTPTLTQTLTLTLTRCAASTTEWFDAPGSACLPAGRATCNVTYPEWVGDGQCDGGEYNTVGCDYDGGDCCQASRTASNPTPDPEPDPDPDPDSDPDPDPDPCRTA